MKAAASGKRPRLSIWSIGARSTPGHIVASGLEAPAQSPLFLRESSIVLISATESQTINTT